MKLPNAESAWVHSDKILKYLLSDTHPAGRGKAIFFKRFEFSTENWQTLDSALRRHALDNPIAGTEDNSKGTLYVIEGTLQTPDGRNPQVRSVWIILTGEENARFVTAYPLED